MTGKYEIPAEMRDIAEKSVQQARQAFTGFLGAVQKSTDNVENIAGGAGNSFKDASSKATAIAEANVTAAFDLAEKMVKAKDIQEIVSLQSEYLKSQFEAVQKQTVEMGATLKDMAAPKK